jgi:hypothetical protein
VSSNFASQTSITKRWTACCDRRRLLRGVATRVMWSRLFDVPVLTPARVRLAYTVAAVTDVLQFVAGPLGWAFADEILDLIAMAVTWRMVGFHPLLLPTFALEFVPLTDMLPTWTGCVALVVALRRRQQVSPNEPAAPGQVIDAKASRVE